ncbi:UDP-glycosyltransferase 90A1-like [Mercurialis annua]|uniref:UDP-glycosyltransferase 90A1-like n=1 Tax=Mercurialis annua TaxID=3986 RepID=UPI0021608FE9|nr:UDP-glycosyltransferase 90A1-like [Mercurialis annua]
MTENTSQYHVALFPFMSKGHTIPLLHLAHLLLRRGITVTIFTTPANKPFMASYLADETTASLIVLPFPQNVPNIPTGIESTDKLPSMSLFPSFALATKLMQPDFEQALGNLRPVSFMVSDGFLWWTLESANKFGFPRLVSYGMSNYSICLTRAVRDEGLLSRAESDDEQITVARYPWIKITRNDFEPSIIEDEQKGNQIEHMMKVVAASKSSYGYVVNSFYELEPVFVDYFNRQSEAKAWCVGPLCLAKLPKVVLKSSSHHQKPIWIKWLDEKLEQEKPVLYVAFGSQAEITPDQLKEIAIGLEKSDVNFLWVTRNKESDLGDGFEERVKDRGTIVRDWVDQMEILEHRSVQGFLSHCGWNSVLESICAGVPILAWPMMAEQPLNAKMVAEEIKIGIRLGTRMGTERQLVKGERLEKKVRELMWGNKGKEVAKRVKEYAETARTAMAEGTGSSWRTLDMLINEICRKQQQEVK